MEIKRKKTVYWILQFLGWFLYGALLYLAAMKTNGIVKGTVLTNLIFSVGLGIFFSNQLRLFFLRKNYFHFNGGILAIRIFAATFIVSVLYTLIAKLFASILYQSFADWKSLSLFLNVISIFVVFILWCTIYFTFLLFEESRKKEINNILLTKTQIELELQNLRSQLNPHFLFNSLNAIRALVETEPDKAKAAINLLSNLLRSTLKLNGVKLVSVEKELELVDAYLQLEKIRFEERLEITHEIGEACNQIMIPSFTIQTLVENSIKHGISKLIQGGKISISVERINNHCEIRVINSGKLENKIDLGIGLSNLKKRLGLQYKSDFSFDIIEINETVEVTIVLPINLSGEELLLN